MPGPTCRKQTRYFGAKRSAQSHPEPPPSGLWKGVWSRGALDPLTFSTILRLIDLALLTLLKPRGRGGEGEGRKVSPGLHSPTPSVTSVIKRGSARGLPEAERPDCLPPRAGSRTASGKGCTPASVSIPAPGPRASPTALCSGFFLRKPGRNSSTFFSTHPGIVWPMTAISPVISSSVYRLPACAHFF